MLLLLSSSGFVAFLFITGLGPHGSDDIQYLRGLTDNAARGIPYALESLQSNNVLVREAAARALGTIGTKSAEATPDLIIALQDTSPNVAASAAWSLGNIRSQDPAAIESLITSLGHTDGEVRRYSAYALSHYGPGAAKAISTLEAALKDTYMAGTAASALGEIGVAARGSIPKMALLLSSPNEGDRAATAFALSKLRPLAEETNDAIVGLLNDNSQLVREITQRAVANLNTPLTETETPAPFTVWRAFRDGCRRLFENEP